MQSGVHDRCSRHHKAKEQHALAFLQGGASEVFPACVTSDVLVCCLGLLRGSTAPIALTTRSIFGHDASSDASADVWTIAMPRLSSCLDSQDRQTFNVL